MLRTVKNTVTWHVDVASKKNKTHKFDFVLIVGV